MILKNEVRRIVPFMGMLSIDLIFWFLLQQEADLVGVLAGDERFATLVVAVQAAELVETLQGGMYKL